MILDDYIVYFNGHSFHIGLKDDPISFSQVKLIPNYDKWITVMKDEMMSMHTIAFEILSSNLKVQNQLFINEFLKPNNILKVTSKDVKHI